MRRGGSLLVNLPVLLPQTSSWCPTAWYLQAPFAADSDLEAAAQDSGMPTQPGLLSQNFKFLTSPGSGNKRQICSCVTCISDREQEAWGKAALQNSDREAKGYSKSSVTNCFFTQNGGCTATPHGQMRSHLGAR